MYCECGCGERTKLATQTNRALGHLKGQPLRFVNGHGNRKGRPAVPVNERFVVVRAGYVTACHEWTGARGANGRGHVRHEGRTREAHIVMWERENGPVPEGLELDHLCRNPPCVRPSHLEPVTHLENMRRGCQAKLTPESAAAIREAAGTQREIAATFGVSAALVSQVRSGQRWVA